MSGSRAEKSRSHVWAWPAGILIGLAIGIPSFGSKGGVAFGVALGVAFAIAFGAAGKRSEGGRADGDMSAGGADGPRGG
ncbi:hypothetical protein [Micromonospora sp. NPDC093244]|uniref:hypothetical protein n=1 Tax=Micromonospora sp. NPDC093244 TaxID=3155071 RepID=UPI00344015EF